MARPKVVVTFTITGKSELVESLYGNLLFFVTRFAIQDIIGQAPIINGLINPNCRTGCGIVISGNFSENDVVEVKKLLHHRLEALRLAFGNTILKKLKPLSLAVGVVPTLDEKDSTHV